MEVAEANPNARPRNRRSSLKPAAEIEADKMKPYREPIRAFCIDIHFRSSDGEEAQIPWTAFRRAVLYRWKCKAHQVPGLGVLPEYQEKETKMLFKSLNQMRGLLDLPPLDFHKQNASEVVTMKRAKVEEFIKKALVNLVDCEGKEKLAGLTVTEEDAQRQGLQFSSLFPEDIEDDKAYIPTN